MLVFIVLYILETLFSDFCGIPLDKSGLLNPPEEQTNETERGDRWQVGRFASCRQLSFLQLFVKYLH